MTSYMKPPKGKLHLALNSASDWCLCGKVVEDRSEWREVIEEPDEKDICVKCRKAV